VEQLEPRCLPSVGVFTYHDDNSSTGQDLAETVLTPSMVKVSTFGKEASVAVDGQVYAQPLYVPNVQGAHGKVDVIVVATENDSVYSIAADGHTVYGKVSFINPGAGITPVPSGDVGGGISPVIGITGTPVVDPTTDTLYVVASTKEIVGSKHHYVQRLHALDLGTGAEKFGGPVVIADTISNDLQNFTFVSGPTVAGTGAGNVGGVITFNALRQLQRPALTLANGIVYVAFASNGDVDPYHGWILGYDATTLKLKVVFNDSPNGSRGGIWQSGGKIDVDANGHLYFMTGNGTFDTALNSSGFPSQGDYGDSFVQLVRDSSGPNNPNINGWGVHVVDYFTPYNQSYLQTNDLDVGSGGPTLLPSSVGGGGHQNLLLGAGKQGVIYLIDRNNMGKFRATGDNVVQELTNPQTGGYFDTPAYFNGRVYYASVGDKGKAYTITKGRLSTQPVSQTPDAFAFPGSTPSVSANGTTGGITWDLDLGTNMLRAYDATNYGIELWTSGQAANNRDALGSVVKFTVPMIANGMVYVGTANSLVVYALLTAAGPGPAAAAFAGPSPSPMIVSVPISDAPGHKNEEEGYYFFLLAVAQAANASTV
jgi:hypothetical protein